MAGEKTKAACHDPRNGKNKYIINLSDENSQPRPVLTISRFFLSLYNSIPKILFPIPKFLRNKFFLAAVGFTAWLLFFDKNDFFAQRERRQELRALQESKRHYQTEIKKEKEFAENLKNDPATIEKFAREKYGMKRDNEDLFLIRKAGEGEKP
jgi:cell division protein FtsB